MLKNKNKIIFLLIFVLGVSIFAAGCSEKEASKNSSKSEETEETEEAKETKETVVVGASGEFFPLNFKKDDKLQGFEIDVWDEIGKRTGYNIEYKTAKFAGLFGMLDAEQIDTICHQIAINPEREEKYSFTESYLNANYQLVVKKDSNLSKLEDFKGKKIGVVAGGLGEKKLKEVNEKNNLDINIQGYEGTAAMDTDLEMGRLDARLGPAIQTSATIKEQDLNFTVTDVVIFSETAAFPFRKNDDNKEIIENINEAIKAMKEDGTLSELSMKWFDIDATK